MGFSKKSNTKKKTGKRFTRRSGKKLKMTSKRRGSKRTKGGWPFGFGEPTKYYITKFIDKKLYKCKRIERSTSKKRKK